MNKKILFFILLLLVAIFYAPHNKLVAQNTSAWQPIFLQVTGGNTMDGVEASFQLNKCNGLDVVYIKFFNHNSYPVKIEWIDAVFTKELKWVNDSKGVDRKSLTLLANTEAKGECANKLYPALLIKMKDFIISKKDFKRYSASQLTVVAVQ